MNTQTMPDQTPTDLARQLRALHENTTQGERRVELKSICGGPYGLIDNNEEEVKSNAAFDAFAHNHASAIAQALLDKEKALKRSCEDRAEDATVIKAICAKHGYPGYFKSAVTCVEELEAKLTRALMEAEEKLVRITDAGDYLWCVLANVSGGNWNEQSTEWQKAVAKARDNWFAQLSQKGGDEPCATTQSPFAPASDLKPTPDALSTEPVASNSVPSSDPKDAEIERGVTEYLAAGGLFNPEFMEHGKVRDLLIDLRSGVASLRAQLAEALRERDEARKKMTAACISVVDVSTQMEALRLQGETMPLNCPLCSGPIIDGQCEECGAYQHLPTINKLLRAERDTALAKLAETEASLEGDESEMCKRLNYEASALAAERDQLRSALADQKRETAETMMAVAKNTTELVDKVASLKAALAAMTELRDCWEKDCLEAQDSLAAMTEEKTRLHVKLIDLLHKHGTGETDEKDGEKIDEMVERIVAERDALRAENERLLASLRHIATYPNTTAAGLRDCARAAMKGDA